MIPFLLLACTSPDPSSDTAADTGEEDASDTGPDTAGDTGKEGIPADTGSGQPGTLWINEFVAYDVASGYANGFDWIEVYNAGATEWDLSRVSLEVDDGDDQLPWMFPSGTTLAPGNFLVVICDETNGAGQELHATFRIARDGGKVYLRTPGAEVQEVVYGYQPTGYSYARRPDVNEWVQDETPTPGAQNDPPADDTGSAP